MAKKSKLKTPDWVLKGEEKPKEKKPERTFKIRKCPECNTDEVSVVINEEKSGVWQCKKCGWKGLNIKEEELNEEEFMKYLDDKDEEENEKTGEGE